MSKMTDAEVARVQARIDAKNQAAARRRELDARLAAMPPLMSDNMRLQQLDRLLDSPLPEVNRAAVNTALLAGECPLQKRRLFVETASHDRAIRESINAALDGRLALPRNAELLDEAREDLAALRLHLTERAFGAATAAMDRREWTSGLQRALAENLTGAAYDERDAMLTFGERTGFASTQTIDGAKVLVEDFSDAGTNPAMVATESGRVSGFAALVEAEDQGNRRVVLDRTAAAMLTPVRRLHEQLVESFLLIDALDYDPADEYSALDNPENAAEARERAWRLATAPVPEDEVGGVEAPVTTSFADPATLRRRGSKRPDPRAPKRVVPASDAYRDERGWHFPTWSRSSWALAQRAPVHTPVGGLTARSENGNAYLALDAQRMADHLRYGQRALGATSTPQVVQILRGLQRLRWQRGL